MWKTTGLSKSNKTNFKSVKCTHRCTSIIWSRSKPFLAVIKRVKYMCVGLRFLTALFQQCLFSQITIWRSSERTCSLSLLCTLYLSPGINGAELLIICNEVVNLQHCRTDCDTHTHTQSWHKALLEQRSGAISEGSMKLPMFQETGTCEVIPTETDLISSITLMSQKVS